jgi:hypothetical protein
MSSLTLTALALAASFATVLAMPPVRPAAIAVRVPVRR